MPSRPTRKNPRGQRIVLAPTILPSMKSWLKIVMRLQAWHEWTRNQGRSANDSDPTPLESSPADEATELEAGVPNTVSTSPPSAAAEPSVARALANIRAEPQQDFAPIASFSPDFANRAEGAIVAPKDRAIRCYRQRTREKHRMN